MGAPLRPDGQLEPDPAQKQKENALGPHDPLSGLLGEFRASQAAARVPAKFPRKFTAAEAGVGAQQASVDLAHLAEEVAAQNLVLIHLCVCVYRCVYMDR